MILGSLIPALKTLYRRFAAPQRPKAAPDTPQALKTPPARFKPHPAPQSSKTAPDKPDPASEPPALLAMFSTERKYLKGHPCRICGKEMSLWSNMTECDDCQKTQSRTGQTWHDCTCRACGRQRLRDGLRKRQLED